MWLEDFPMHFAARHGDQDTVEWMFNIGFSINSRDDENLTPLYYAVSFGSGSQSHLEVIKFLIQQDCDINTPMPQGLSALQLAAMRHEDDVVQLLIGSGADLLHTDDRAWNILHYVCKSGNLNVVQYLMDKKLDVNAQSSEGFTPVFLAAMNEHKEIFDLLVKKGADLLKCMCSIELKETILHYASQNGWPDFVQYFIDQECDLDLNTSLGRNPLMLAVKYGKIDVFWLLVESGADPNARDCNNYTALHFAADGGWIDVVQYFIDEKFDLDLQTSDGDTALTLAAFWGHEEVFYMLYKAGANPKLNTDYEFTVLHYASRDGLLDIVTDVVKLYSTIDIKDCNGDTPLHVACANGRIDVIEHLLDSGADVNSKNNDDGTPLSDVLMLGEPNLEIISLLIKNGAYFSDFIYEQLQKVQLFREHVLTDAELCAQAIVSKFNTEYLPAIYRIPGVAKVLPAVEILEIKNERNVARDIVKCVESEIQLNGFCNVMNLKPVLILLAVQSLVDHHSVDSQ